MQPFSILDLPNELIRQICLDDEMDRNDLMALRLMCKLINALVTHAFDHMCFSGISVLMTRRSLQALIQIYKHPRIGPQIQVVTLTPLRAFQEALPILVPPNSSIHREDDPEKLRASTKLVYHYLNRCCEETELEQSGDAGVLLKAAFSSLGGYEHDRSLCLKVSDVGEMHVGGRGYLSSTTNEHNEEMNWWKTHWVNTMRVLVKAVIESECQIARLSLASCTDADHMDHASLWNDNLNGDINRLCSSLTAFDVDFDCQDTDNILRSVRQVLSQAENLKILTVQQIGPLLSYGLAEILDSVASDWLEVINISNVFCIESDLVSFLNKHKSTIEHFCLYRIRLVGSWRSMVEWIRSNLTALHTFGMEHIFDDEYQPNDNAKSVPACNFYEIEDIQNTLDELLRKPRRSQSDETRHNHSTN